MIIRLLGVAAAVLVTVSGTAHAHPVKGEPTLTHNKIYKKPALPKTTCKPAKGTSKSSTEKYVKKLVSCLNTAWKGTIDGFQPVKVMFTTEKESCSSGMDIAGSYATICGTVIRVRLADDWIKAKSDLKAFAVITRTWSGVVQGQTGIGQAWWRMDNDPSGDEVDEQTHRFYLQADCFAGVSAKSLGRKIKDFKALIAGMEPPEYGYLKYNGKPANRVYWLKKGYQAGRAGACNTWTAGSPKVA
ncbi:hypothetical protein Aph01nite_45180 [Acrocarpospora phusangensis]|uniref:Metalloprotease n=1 Tax=Acrocarpospora phusangensis TaxID=1070424 RepID=A0A919UQA4_9ACTN|nr:hypothetical protein [Acrocarpospora phusangensis]GIH26208.1 hypothetical protein Aph01nite_45180 [Acrocarpospora phusangensis]